LFGCRNKSEIATTDIEKRSGPDELIDNFTVISVIGDSQEWYMTSEFMKRFNSERRWVGYNVIMETLNSEDMSFYKSDSIFVSDITNILTGMGNVEIINPRGILKTDLIHWNRRSDQIHAPNDVYMTRDGHEFWGTNLHTNSSMDYIDLRNVSGEGVLSGDM
jgi:lipopolysaccharide assembly outer membrane protein LptD (OstA)